MDTYLMRCGANDTGETFLGKDDVENDQLPGPAGSQFVSYMHTYVCYYWSQSLNLYL